jgi:hypothetical protein
MARAAGREIAQGNSSSAWTIGENMMRVVLIFLLPLLTLSGALRAAEGRKGQVKADLLADVSAILGSLDIVFGEIDR